MKKQTVRYIVIAVISLLLVLACCFGIYVYLSGRNSHQGKSVEIIGFSPETVESIKITNGNYHYELEKDDGFWRLEDNEDKILVQQSVKEAVNVFSLIKGTEVKLKESPAFSIRVEIEKSFSDIIFMLAKADGKYYLKTSKDKIYEVSQVIYSVADRKADFYRDKTVTDIRSFGKEGENKFVSYNYKFKDDDGKTKETNLRLKNASEVSRYDSSSQYMMTTPYVRAVDKDVFEEKVLTKIPLITVENFVYEKAELSEFGLDKNSRGVLTVKYDNKTFVLYVGDDVENSGEVYCMTPGIKEVFTVKRETLDFLAYSGFEYADKNLFPYNESYIKNVRIKSGKLDVNIKSQGESFYVDETPVSNEIKESFFEELKKIKISSIEKSASGGAEIMQITITGSDGASFNYKVLKTNDEKILISEGNMYLKADIKDINAFLEYLKQLEKTPV